MICSICGDVCMWEGLLVNLTHAKCQGCGAINSQIPEEPTELELELEAEESASEAS